MKQGIHPEYNRINVVCTTCGNEFESGSVKKEIRVDTCDLLRKKFVLTLAQTVIHSTQDVKNSLKLMDVSNASTKNTESTLNSFDFETPPFVWCFFLFILI